MLRRDAFPRLTDRNHRITSASSVNYNCVAWAAGDTQRWWQPGGYYWPVEASRDNHGIGALQQAFEALGYRECADESPEPKFEKIALYGSGFNYTHVARQLPNGEWTSKLGKAEDIEHDTPDAVAGGIYGEVVQYMKRPMSATTAAAAGRTAG